MARKVLSAILTLKDKDFSSNMRKAGKGMSDLDRKVKRSGNQIRRFKDNAVSSFSSVAKSAAGLVAAYAGFEAFRMVASTAITASSNLEQYRNTLNIVMDDQEKAAKTMSWAVDFANKTPFETDSIVQATVRLQSYGLEAQKVLPMVGDMAGVMGKDVMQAVEAVADAQTGELERLKEFGITKKMIAKKAGEMYKGQQIINNKGQIVEQEKFNKALFALMQDRYKGGMEQQANTFKGVMSTITGVWKTSLATMMGISKEGEIVQGGMFDTIKTKAQAFSSKLTEMANDGTFEKWSEKIASGIKKASEWFGKAKDVTVAFYEKAKVVASFLKKYEADIYGIAAGIAAYKIGIVAITTAKKVWTAVTTAQAIAMGVLNGTIAISPLGWVAIAIGAVVAAGVLLYKNWDKVKAAAVSLWDMLKSAWSGIKSGFSSMWTGMKTAASSGINFVIGGVNKMIGALNSLASFKVPDWVPGIGGKGISVNIPKVPKYATGTSYAPGGLSMINESGRGEIVDLPSGSRVYPHDKSVQMARNETKNDIKININAVDKSVTEIINELVPQLKLRLQNM